MTLSLDEQAPVQQTSKQVVDALFAAMQSGDRDQILALLSENVEWWVSDPPEIPYAGTFRGRDEVDQFFATFTDAVDYEPWEAQQYVTEGDTVVVIGEERWRAKSSGQIVDNPWVLVITVQDDKILRFRAYEDTAAAKDAYLGSDALRRHVQVRSDGLRDLVLRERISATERAPSQPAVARTNRFETMIFACRHAVNPIEGKVTAYGAVPNPWATG